jgi:hypothetical protein
LIIGPAVFDGNVLPLDMASVFQALAECVQKAFDRARRSGIEKPDDRHRRLLRAGSERPCCRAAAGI